MLEIQSLNVIFAMTVLAFQKTKALLLELTYYKRAVEYCQNVALTLKGTYLICTIYDVNVNLKGLPLRRWGMIFFAIASFARCNGPLNRDA